MISETTSAHTLSQYMWKGRNHSRSNA